MTHRFTLPWKELTVPAKTKITEDIQIEIEGLISSWKGKLTWDLLTQKIQLEMGIKISRQTLISYKSLHIAYKHKKTMLRCKDPNILDEIPSNWAALIKRLKKLESQLEVKNRIINEQKRFLQRVLHNAAEIPALKGNLEALIAERPEDKF